MSLNYHHCKADMFVVTNNLESLAITNFFNCGCPRIVFGVFVDQNGFKCLMGPWF